MKTVRVKIVSPPEVGHSSAHEIARAHISHEKTGEYVLRIENRFFGKKRSDQFAFSEARDLFSRRLGCIELTERLIQAPVGVRWFDWQGEIDPLFLPITDNETVGGEILSV